VTSGDHSAAGRGTLLLADISRSPPNHVAELFGRPAYALVTESAAAQLDIPRERALPITERHGPDAPVPARVLTLP
jgi:hypothetical protein